MLIVCIDYDFKKLVCLCFFFSRRTAHRSNNMRSSAKNATIMNFLKRTSRSDHCCVSWELLFLSCFVPRDRYDVVGVFCSHVRTLLQDTPRHDIFGEFTNEKKYILLNPENYFDFPTCAERAPVHVLDTTAKKKMFINKFKNSIILLRLRKFTIVARGLATLLTLSRKKKKRCIKKNEHIVTQFFHVYFSRS